MSSFRKCLASLLVAASFVAAPVVSADQLTPKQLADARTRVETAANLAAIGKAEKDSELLLVAAKLLSKVDAPVALPGSDLKDGKPTSLALGSYLDEAKALGADTSKAAMSKPLPASDYCYWYYSCDSYNNCMWIYVC
ncbi:MAG: hypothetical protein AB7F76_01720 [Parvibaculaceae bacterium]